MEGEDLESKTILATRTEVCMGDILQWNFFSSHHLEVYLIVLVGGGALYRFRSEFGKENK